MDRQKAPKEETRKVIPYYSELRELIPNLGFNNSSKLFNFLQQCGIGFFYYDRIYTSEDRITLSVEELKKMRNEGFIFVMSVVDFDAVDVIYIDGISKEELIKYLKLKVFS